VLRRATGNLNSQDSPWPGLGGSHHLPPYSILCASSWGPHPNDIFPSGNPEIVKVGTLMTLGAYNFSCRPRVEMKSKAKLYALSRAFQWYVASCLHASKSGWFLTFNGRELNCQFDSRPFFGHNLCLKCPNGWCEPILDIYVLISFQWYKKTHQSIGFWPLQWLFEHSKVH